MKVNLIVVVVIFLSMLDTYGNSIGALKNSNEEIYKFCQAETGTCLRKCKVKLIKGDRIQLGSYIQVFDGKEKVTEGYILQHIDGNIYILKNKRDAQNPEICGGCCGGAFEINMKKKEIWGC